MEPAHVPDRLLLKILLTAAVVATCVWVGVAGARHAPPYYAVDALSAAGIDSLEGDYLRVRGFVVGGTIAHEDAETHHFLLTSNGIAIRVVLHGELPDTMRDRSEAVVSGRLVKRDGFWVLDGEEIFSRCATKYEGSSTDAAVKFQ